MSLGIVLLCLVTKIWLKTGELCWHFFFFFFLLDVSDIMYSLCINIVNYPLVRNSLRDVYTHIYTVIPFWTGSTPSFCFLSLHSQIHLGGWYILHCCLDECMHQDVALDLWASPTKKKNREGSGEWTYICLSPWNAHDIIKCDVLTINVRICCNQTPPFKKDSTLSFKRAKNDDATMTLKPLDGRIQS